MRHGLLLGVAIGAIAAMTTAVGCDDDATTTTSSSSGTSSSGASSGSTSTGGACMLPQETIDALSLGINPTWGAQPGDTIDFDLGVTECCYVFNEVDACAVFSIEPTTGATIDPMTGVFVVDPGAAPGSVYTVTADVESGRRLVTTKVYVYTPESNPLVGLWTEESQLACGSKQPGPPEQSIGELAFRPDMTFGVTWQPFELYVDYWGTYAFDLASGAITLTVEGGNYTPPDVDGVGTFSVQGGKLTLDDVWLGTPSGGTAPAACGHVFQ